MKTLSTTKETKFFANAVSYFGLIVLVLALGQTGALSLGSNGTDSDTAPNSPQIPTSKPGAQERGSPLDFDCPPTCLCHYEPDPQHLKISCQREGTTVSPTPPRKLSLTNGVRHLGINHATLNSFTIPKIIPPLAKNNLVELSLHNVILDPLLLFSADLFLSSKESLRKIRVCDAHTLSEPPVYLAAETRLRLPYIFSLESLDSLTLCNNSPGLSNLLLNALPPVVKHITLVNSSIPTLDPVTFSHFAHLESLNLSRNHIQSIPWGTLKPLTNLRLLDISQNRIQHLQEEVFVGLGSLHKLNVSNNLIRYVDTDVFNPLTAIHTIDMSENDVIQIFEPYFEDNAKLKTLLMSNTWQIHSFTDPDTAARSRMEMDKLLDTLQVVDTLDLRDNGMRTIPETLAHLPHLKRAYISGNLWDCTCQDRWVQNWITTAKVSIDNFNDTKGIWCHSNEIDYQFSSFISRLACTNPIITARTPKKYYGLIGQSTLLQCHTQREEGPVITWMTPKKQRLVTGSRLTEVNHADHSPTSYLRVLRNGNLYISNLTMEEFGLYLCTASYPGLNITHYVHLGMDTSIFLDVKFFSIIVGWATSFGFLATVLTVQLVRCLLRKCGIDCPSVSPYKARRVRAFFDNMEQHKNSQLEWLRDNYNMQAKRIKENCMSQLERIRDSYTTQTKNLSDIRDYGAHQIHTMRDQYHDQIRKVSSYSTHQLCKVRENYVFQRNRVGKFSSHQLLKLRETYKWQAQTLNKILENLPKTLTLDTCRGIAACGRTDSIYLDDMSELRPEGLLLDPSQLRIGDAPGNSRTKLEHVSLLIPPEFFLVSPEETIHMFPIPIQMVERTFQTLEEEEETTDAVEFSTPSSSPNHIGNGTTESA